MLWLLGFLGGLGCLGKHLCPQVRGPCRHSPLAGVGLVHQAGSLGCCPHGQPQSLSPHQDPGELPLCDKDTGLRALVDCKEGLEGTKDSVLVVRLGAAPFYSGGEVKSLILPL